MMSVETIFCEGVGDPGDSNSGKGRRVIAAIFEQSCSTIERIKLITACPIKPFAPRTVKVDFLYKKESL